MTQGGLKFDSKVQFAGHETFPLRLLWLKKAYDAIGDEAHIGVFQEQEAITRFGVGRNMAASMRYWANTSGFFEEAERIIRPTPIGRAILRDGGLDPFLEQMSTIWLVHWHIASLQTRATTTFYAFNVLNAIDFEPATLLDEIFGLAKAQGWRATRGTLKRDIEVFLRSYVRKGAIVSEDAAEPLLAELSIIREARLGGWYEFVRGPKPTLHDAIFTYALGSFWERSGGSTTLTAEQICYAPGSPGRVFKLDEDSVVTRLMRLDDVTNGAWQWVDTAGLRQIQRTADIDTAKLIRTAYRVTPSRRAAP
ncbi:DUF4007 family protein [Paenirhodobacter populi]|uniref:DUF4007 family protein n=1 Tax=Paenirhodobacter populi TaxID=2306993 RepID=UPI0013E389B3|nr:DUF4007 family protein [Sinirhodobacter populi]